jgi:hypothetical protein
MSWTDFFGDAYDYIKDNPQLVGAGLGLLAGSQGSETQTTTQAPYLYPGQLEGIGNVINLAGQEYRAGPQQYYPGQTVAGLDPNLIAGQNAQLGTVGQQGQLADLSAFAAGDLLQGGAGRIEGFDLPSQIGFGIDPGLQNAVMNPIMRNLEERVLPGLDLQATHQGAFGGTRHALMKGQAASDAVEQSAEAVARANLEARQQSIGQRAHDMQSMLEGRQQDVQQNQLYNTAVGAGINALPGAMGNLLMPGQTMMDIGKQRTAYDQALIDADKARFDFNQAAPIDALTRLQSRMTLQGAPGGAVTTIPGQDASWLNILGGGLAGYHAGKMFKGTAGTQPTGSPGAWTSSADPWNNN